MPIVAINLTPDEALRLDTLAEQEKRARRAQLHVMFLQALAAAELRKDKARKEAQ